MNAATRINKTSIVVSEEHLPPDEMIEVAKAILGKRKNVIAILASRKDRVALVGAVNDVNLQISKLLNELAQIVGGKAGGRGQIAQGGGPDVSKFDEMLTSAKVLIEKAIRDSPNF